MNEATVQFVDARGQPLVKASADTAHAGASRTARGLRGWNPPLASADAELLDELETLVSRGRDLVRNHGVANGAIQTLVDNVVGTGFRLQARPDYVALGKTKEWADAWAKNTEAHWRTWANTTECDAARQLTFSSMTALQFRTGMMSGEAIGVPLWLNRPGARWKTAVMLVDPDRLANPPGRMNDERLRAGIEIANYGEPVAYWLAKRHPADLPYWQAGINDFERIPARTSFGRLRVIHVHDKERTGQTRGKPIMSSIIGNFKMLDHYQRTELQSAVVNAMIAAFVESPMTGEQLVDLFGGAPEKYLQDRSAWEAKLSGGAIIPMYPGDKLAPFVPGRPSAAYKDFIETVLRESGVSIGLPYELLMRDFSKTNYSSARAALLEAWRFFNGKRHWLCTYWCQPVYELWLEEAINAGLVEAPGFYENRAAYARCEWIGNGRGWIDPVKEAEAAGIRMENGVSTLARECAEQGLDWEEVLEQRAIEHKRMRELDLLPTAPQPQAGSAPGERGKPGEQNGNDGEEGE